MPISVNHSEMIDHIIKAYETKTSLFIQGGTGIGKSYGAVEAGRRLADRFSMDVDEGVSGDKDNFRVIDFRIADKRPADLRGLPDLSGDRTTWKVPEFLPSEGRGLIVLEEFNLADKSLQAPAYQLVLGRKMGTYQVPDGFGIIALGNRREDKANVHDLGDPLKNRFDWVELKEPSPQRWIQWAVDNDIDSRVISFIKKGGSEMLYDPPSSAGQKVFPTPRGWERVGKKIQGEPDDKLSRYATPTVGKAIAEQFESFVRLVEGFDVQSIIENPRSAELPNRTDEQYALSSHIAPFFKDKETKTQKINFLKKTGAIADRLPPSFGSLLIGMVAKHDKKFVRRELPRLDTFKDFSEEYLKYIASIDE